MSVKRVVHRGAVVAGIIGLAALGLAATVLLATVGIIASVSEPFCAACDRTRLTADGQVRNCLFSELETDLRGPLREGASDEDLAALIQGEMWRKKRGHGIGDPGFRQPDRPMSSIGG